MARELPEELLADETLMAKGYDGVSCLRPAMMILLYLSVTECSTYTYGRSPKRDTCPPSCRGVRSVPPLAPSSSMFTSKFSHGPVNLHLRRLLLPRHPSSA